MKKAGAKPYHKYKTQKLTNHKVRRVGFAKWMLLKFGSTRPGRNLRHLINTEFSAKIRVNPSRNSKNENVWGIVKERVAKKKMRNSQGIEERNHTSLERDGCRQTFAG